MFNTAYNNESEDELSDYQDRVDCFLRKISSGITATVILEDSTVYFKLYFDGAETNYFLDKNMKIIYWKEKYNLYLTLTIEELLSDFELKRKMSENKQDRALLFP
jgi:hypothetical protein